MRFRAWVVTFGLLGTMSGVEPAGAVTVTATPARVTSFLLPEVTAVAIPPGKNKACPGGRLVFASGVDLARTALDGSSPVSPAQITLTPTIGEIDPFPIYDNHMVALSDGSVVHTVEGLTWDGLEGRVPAWWQQSIEYPAKNLPGRAGARAAIWAFRSTDCGTNWTLAGKVDAATLQVEDPATGKPAGARCGTLRRFHLCKDTSLKDRTNLRQCPLKSQQIKFSEAGGFDGHYLAVDPANDLLVISTPCIFGTGLNTQSAFQVLVVSDDRGKTWTSSVSLPQNTWRGPVAAVGGGKWAYAWSDGQAIRLAIDDPVTGTFAQSTVMAPFNDVAAAQKDTIILNTGTPGALDLAVNPVPVGSFQPVPGGAVQPLMRNLVQVSSPTWSASTKAHTFQIHNLDPATGALTVATAKIESSAAQQSVVFGSFLQGHRASLFYWLEEVGPGTYRVRYQAYHRGKPLLKAKKPSFVQVPGTIRNLSGRAYQFTTTAETPQGDYMKGSHFLEAGGVERFFLFWNDRGNVAYAEVRVAGLPQEPARQEPGHAAK
jgi:hypothetical protein